jgi:hypothetical protein
LGGCLPVASLHPLFNEKDIVFDEKLLGTWVDPNSSSRTTWEFKLVDGHPNTYSLIFSDQEGKKGLFEAYLVKLKKQLFLDVRPSEPPWKSDDPNKLQWEYNVLFLLPAHGFAKVSAHAVSGASRIEPQLKLRMAGGDKFKAFLERDPNAVKHTILGERIILTAETRELQEFFSKYGDAEIYTDEMTLTRRPSDPPKLAPDSSGRSAQP